MAMPVPSSVGSTAPTHAFASAEVCSELHSHWLCMSVGNPGCTWLAGLLCTSATASAVDSQTLQVQRACVQVAVNLTWGVVHTSSVAAGMCLYWALQHELPSMEYKFLLVCTFMVSVLALLLHGARQSTYVFVCMCLAACWLLAADDLTTGAGPLSVPACLHFCGQPRLCFCASTCSTGAHRACLCTLSIACKCMRAH